MHAEEPNQAGYVRYVTRRYGNLVDAFSVTSEHLKETVVDYEIPPSRVEVIHSGVDGIEEFNPELVEPLTGNDERPRILWPGRLVEQKDPMLTLDALSRVRDRGTEFVLEVVGDGQMKPSVQARAMELGLAEAIRWHPPSQEMPRWYRSADLLLMTSVYEGVPYVIYEALAMGVPVVAPAIPGNVEFMDAHSGVLVDPRDDPERYADAIVELIGDPQRRAELGERSRRRMLEDFSLGEMGRHHDELYERLLASRPASSRWRDDALFGNPKSSSDHGDAGDLRASIALPRDPLPERTVGVIVPCFRHGIFLDGCIASIKAQTLPPAQIVVVDDGSDDPETVAALERLDADPEVTVVRLSQNSGPSAARNRGLRELDTAYMLPIDADDELLPDALERMLTQLEDSDEDVGFVYPHAQHFGNRTDFVQLPAYNLWLLMQENYCPAPALFDMRLFGDAGVSYPEDIVVGHEDWDLILQLAECGIRGLHADGPTFLYRRQGFSRVNAVDYGPQAFHEAIERRHPALYGRRDSIKASWSPALSIVLLEGNGEWSEAANADLARQSCTDFELLSGADMQAAIEAARGRWVALLRPQLEPALSSHCLVEQLLHGFVAHEGVSAVVLAESAGADSHALAQLDDEERLSARPAGLVFERLPLGLSRFDLGEGDPLAELAIHLQANGGVQWRGVPTAQGAADPKDTANLAARPGELNLDFDRRGDRSEVAMRISVARQAPRLPELSVNTVRRWESEGDWLPPGSQPLCRHVQLDGEHRLVSNDPQPPPGYALEFELGALQAQAVPGTRRLVQSGQEFELSDDQDDLGNDRHGYGYVERQPLPLLEHLELRRLPTTSQQVLVAGPDDPLFGVAQPLHSIGWIEARPILPRGDVLHCGPWGVDVLWREFEDGAWRHRYRATPPGEPTGQTALGSLFRHPAKGLVALRLRSDGRLVSDLAHPGRASRHPAKIGRWAAAPLGGGSRGTERSAVGEATARMRHIARGRRLSKDAGDALGWLRTDGAPGCSPLFSATHPITGDQLVTCSEREAIVAGYPLEGVLGYILDAGSDRLA